MLLEYVLAGFDNCITKDQDLLFGNRGCKCVCLCKEKNAISLYYIVFMCLCKYCLHFLYMRFLLKIICKGVDRAGRYK